MLYAARSHIGLVRQVNEDGFAVHPEYQPYQFLIIADGMGGASAGEVASKMAVETVSDCVQRGVQEENCDVADLLRDAILEANKSIMKAAAAREEYAGMGTTVVAALYNKDSVAFVHVGDSRGYLFSNHELIQVTKDHSLVAELVRRGQLTEEEAKVHPIRNVVTRSLGTLEFSHPDVQILPWSEGDVLLLCSDGLSNLVTTAELQAQLESLQEARTHEDVGRVADTFIRLALERGAPDNITIALAVHREGRIGE